MVNLLGLGFWREQGSRCHDYDWVISSQFIIIEVYPCLWTPLLLYIFSHSPQVGVCALSIPTCHKWSTCDGSSGFVDISGCQLINGGYMFGLDNLHNYLLLHQIINYLNICCSAHATQDNWQCAWQSNYLLISDANIKPSSVAGFWTQTTFQVVMANAWYSRCLHNRICDMHKKKKGG